MNKSDGDKILDEVYTHATLNEDGNIVFDGSPNEIDERKFQDIYGEDAEEVEIR